MSLCASWLHNPTQAALALLKLSTIFNNFQIRLTREYHAHSHTHLHLPLHPQPQPPEAGFQLPREFV